MPVAFRSPANARPWMAGLGVVEAAVVAAGMPVTPIAPRAALPQAVRAGGRRSRGGRGRDACHPDRAEGGAPTGGAGWGSSKPRWSRQGCLSPRSRRGRRSHRRCGLGVVEAAVVAAGMPVTPIAPRAALPQAVRAWGSQVRLQRSPGSAALEAQVRQDQPQDDAQQHHPGADQEPALGRVVAEIAVLLFDVLGFPRQIGHALTQLIALVGDAYRVGGGPLDAFELPLRDHS